MIEDIRDITGELTDTEKILLDAARGYKTSARSAAIARFGYDVAWAELMLLVKTESDASGVKMTVGEKESLAVLAVKNEMQDVRIKESEADASKRYLSAVEAVLSSIQTRARLIQAEMNLMPPT